MESVDQCQYPALSQDIAILFIQLVFADTVCSVQPIQFVMLCVLRGPHVKIVMLDQAYRP